jgi:hypothetical protein
VRPGTLFSACLVCGLALASAGAAAAADCAALEKQFAAVYPAIETACEGHADCAVGYYNWDPCVAQAAAKLQHVDNFEQTRAELHRHCGYIVKPCPSLSEPVYCVKRRCALHSEVLAGYKNLRFRVPGVKNGEFVLMEDTGIRCERAPCPAARELRRGKIKNHRFELPLKLLLEGEADPDRPLARLEPVSLAGRYWFTLDNKLARADLAAWLKDPGREIILKP